MHAIAVPSISALARDSAEVCWPGRMEQDGEEFTSHCFAGDESFVPADMEGVLLPPDCTQRIQEKPAQMPITCWLNLLQSVSHEKLDIVTVRIRNNVCDLYLLLDFAEACTALCWCHWEIQSRQGTFLSLWMWCLFDHFRCLWTFCLDFVVFNSVTCPKCSLQWKWLYGCDVVLCLSLLVYLGTVFFFEKSGCQGQKSLGTYSIPFVQFAGVWVSSDSSLFMSFFTAKMLLERWNCGSRGRLAEDDFFADMVMQETLKQWDLGWKPLPQDERDKVQIGGFHSPRESTRINGIHGLALALQAEPAQIGRHVPIQECGISFAYRSCGG